MWWKRTVEPEAAKEVSIRASLHKGETLQITFVHDGSPRHLRIEGRGDISLAVVSDAEVTAELLNEQKLPIVDDHRKSKARRGQRSHDPENLAVPVE